MTSRHQKSGRKSVLLYKKVSRIYRPCRVGFAAPPRDAAITVVLLVTVTVFCQFFVM